MCGWFVVRESDTSGIRCLALVHRENLGGTGKLTLLRNRFLDE